MYSGASTYLCVCESPTKSGGPARGSALPDLYFCPACQQLRCTSCANVDIVARFCANCMTDYTQTPGQRRCVRCFECPRCRAPLLVSVEDLVVGQDPAKVFAFACVCCDFGFRTQPATKPAPLASIVRADSTAQFQALARRFGQMEKLRLLQQALERKAADLVRGRLRAMRIKEPLPETFAEIDKLKSDLKSTLTVSHSEDIERPVGKHLTAKYKYSCAECKTVLLDQVADPRLMKVLGKHYAVDTVPLLVAERRGDTAILAVVNPLPCSIGVEIEHLESKHTAFSVGAHKDKQGILAGVPTPFLSGLTADSRAERLSRAVSREKQRAAAQAQQHEVFFESGANWVVFPFSAAESSVAVRVSVKSRLPEGWFDKRDLSFSFWAFLTIGPEAGDCEGERDKSDVNSIES